MPAAKPSPPGGIASGAKRASGGFNNVWSKGGGGGGGGGGGWQTQEPKAQGPPVDLKTEWYYVDTSGAQQGPVKAPRWIWIWIWR